MKPKNKEPTARKKPRHPWAKVFSPEAFSPENCVSAKYIGYTIYLREVNGGKFSGRITDVTATTVSVDHREKGFRMFTCSDIEVLNIKKKGRGCGCRKS